MSRPPAHSTDLRLPRSTRDSAAAVVPAPETTDPAALLAHLRRHAPETLALANEWPALVQRLPVLAGAIQVKVKEDPEYKGLGMMSLHYRPSTPFTSMSPRLGPHH